MNSSMNTDLRYSTKSHLSHVGFNREVPETVTWSDQAYVKALPVEERREMCRTSTTIYMTILAIFVLAIIFSLAHQVIQNKLPWLGFPSMNLLLLIIWVMTIGMFLGSQFLNRVMVIHKIRNRAGKLFPPHEGVVVSIEDAFTYDKRKMVVEDFGLLRITPDCVQLEMSNHRAQFDRQGLSVSLLHTAKNAAGIRLSYNQGYYSWTVVVCPLANTGILCGFSQGAVRAKALLKLFNQMGYGSRSRAETVTANESNPKPAETAGQPEQTTDAGEENADIMEARYKNILAAIDEKLNQRKKNWWKNAGILLISLLIFFQLGFFRWGLESVLMLILVLFIHEMGHYLGMKLFGYRNVQMFFIPMFGAAVSGASHNVAAWKKAMVSLLGPLPGIVISLILFVIAIITSNQNYFNTGAAFLFINLLNLLPVMPLDGGRFLQEILFSRNRYLELIMNILAGIALIWLGITTKSRIFSILGILSLSTIRFRFQLAGTAQRFKKDLAAQRNTDSNSSVHNINGLDIPESVLKNMLLWIHTKLPGPMKPKDIANLVLEIWDRIQLRPARWGTTLLLLFLFGMGYAISLVSLGVGMFGYSREFGRQSKIVACGDPNTSPNGYKEQIYFLGELEQEFQLSEDKQFYNGPCFFYFDEELAAEGQWEMGKRSGKWLFFSEPNLLTEEVFYEDGLPVLKRALEDGQWEEYQWEDFPEKDKIRCLRRAEKPRGPADSQRDK